MRILVDSKAHHTPIFLLCIHSTGVGRATDEVTSWILHGWQTDRQTDRHTHTHTKFLHYQMAGTHHMIKHDKKWHMQLWRITIQLMTITFKGSTEATHWLSLTSLSLLSLTLLTWPFLMCSISITADFFGEQRYMWPACNSISRQKTWCCVVHNRRLCHAS